ncbi:serine/threonine protein kinase [Minicystis rosea]|nr:serine/threonine protein kinase [Minicystis rosea]
MGAVYEVEDRATGTRAALKVMLASDAGRLLRFKQEFRVMAEVHHPNLVRLFDLGQHEGQWFFTMELVHGHDLLHVLLPEEAAFSTSGTTLSAGPEETSFDTQADDAPRGRRPVACDLEAFSSVMGQILEALELLHGRGIVHRDLKPSNILVDVEGTARLLDFGLASRVDRSMVISQEGAIVGTLAYLSPEQCRGEAASPASDLYALGCMMFQLLSGKLPFQGPPGEAMMMRIERPPPRVDERVSGVPPLLADIVHRLMARTPAERPALAEVREALGLGARPSLPRAPGPVETGEIFVGRESEIATLTRCLSQAAGGEVQCAFVSGPSGIGKSALCSTIARRAVEMGFICFRGRCYEREQVPFVAFDRIVDAMTLALRRWSPARLAAVRPALMVLERIFPALGMITGAPSMEMSRIDPRELHRQALDGWKRLVDHCQIEAPICFVLDDLQWADEESIALLAALTEGGAGRIMVLGSLRSQSLGPDHPLDRLLREMAATERATSIALAPLDASDAERLVRTVTGGRLDPEMTTALAGQAEGNPFLVRRLAEHLATLPPMEQTARLDAKGAADDLIREMIQALSPRAEKVLAIGATAGGDISAPVLRETSGLGGEEFDLAVSELLSARFFKAVPRGAEGGTSDIESSPRLDLYHDRIREVAYQGLAEERRRSLHRSLALSLAARPGVDGRDAEILVHHWTEAGDLRLRRRYAFEAAEQAASMLAFVHAARLFRMGLEDLDPDEDPLTTAARWERVGELFEYGGHHLEAARAHQEALVRWEAAPADHPERTVALLRLYGVTGANLMATPHLREGREVFARGLAILGLPLERAPLGRILTLLGLGARKVLGEWVSPRPAPDETRPLLAAQVRFLDLLVRAFQPIWPWPAAEAALRAELLGRRIDDQRVLQRSLAFGASVPLLLGRCSPAQIERAHRRLDEAEALAQAHDLVLGREVVQINRSLLWLATNLSRARQTIETALAGFARRGMSDSFDGHVARIFHLLVLYCKGDDDEAFAVIDHELGVALPNFINLALALTTQTRLLARRGRLIEARAALERLETQCAGAPASRLQFILACARANVLVAEGRFADALAESEPEERAARASGGWAVGMDRSLWIMVQLEAALGVLRTRGLPARERARLRSRARWLARRGVFDSGCVGHRALALLDHAEGNPRAAARSLHRALALSNVNTSPYHRWICLEAARDLRAITLDQDSESAELAAAGHFALPLGWRPAAEG